jgi:hypothetical protein
MHLFKLLNDLLSALDMARKAADVAEHSAYSDTERMALVRSLVLKDAPAAVADAAPFSAAEGLRAAA